MSHDVVRSANYVISSKCKKYLNIAQLALNIRSVAALTLARDHEEAPPWRNTRAKLSAYARRFFVGFLFRYLKRIVQKLEHSNVVKENTVSDVINDLATNHVWGKLTCLSIFASLFLSDIGGQLGKVKINDYKIPSRLPNIKPRPLYLL